ncbi:MAG: LPS export ABC transporter permease LptF [Hyphomicrobiaceae bacterium]
MSIISKYVFRQAAGALILILLSLGGIIWIALALKRLNVVTSQGQDSLLLLKMTTLALPNLLAIIAPFAMLIAVMQTLNRLNSDSELIVLTASGATIWSVGRPLILLGFLVSVAVAFTNHVGMPWSLQKLRDYVVQVRTDLLSQVIQPGRFSSPEKGLTFHIRERSANGELLGLVMHDTRNPKEPQSYLAERGQIVKQDPDAFMVMTNGHIMRSNDPKSAPEIIEFQKYAIDLEQFDRKQNGSRGYKPRETFTSGLISPDKDNPRYKHNPGQFRAELHERFSNPLYPLAFILIALATVGQTQSTRQNRFEGLVVGFIGATGLRMAGLAVNNLVVVSPIYVPLLYLLPLLAMAGALFAIRQGARRKAGPQMRERIGDFFAPVSQPILARLPRLKTTSNALPPATGGERHV